MRCFNSEAAKRELIEGRMQPMTASIWEIMQQQKIRIIGPDGSGGKRVTTLPCTPFFSCRKVPVSTPATQHTQSPPLHLMKAKNKRTEISPASKEKSFNGIRSSMHMVIPADINLIE